jgi:hypothetical protein
MGSFRWIPCSTLDCLFTHQLFIYLTYCCNFDQATPLSFAAPSGAKRGYVLPCDFILLPASFLNGLWAAAGRIHPVDRSIQGRRRASFLQRLDIHSTRRITLSKHLSPPLGQRLGRQNVQELGPVEGDQTAVGCSCTVTRRDYKSGLL